MRKAAIACFAVLDYTKQRILVECSQVVEEEKTDMIFGEKTEEQKRAIGEYYLPYDYWYTPLVERDHHVNFTDMPETVANIRRLVDESLVAGEVQHAHRP